MGCCQRIIFLPFKRLYLNFTFLFAAHYIFVSPHSKITSCNAKDLSNFIINVFNHSPKHLKLFLKILAIFYYFNCVLFFFYNFTITSHHIKHNLINRWKYSRFKPLRDFIRFHETLSDFYSISKPNKSID